MAEPCYRFLRSKLYSLASQECESVMRALTSKRQIAKSSQGRNCLPPEPDLSSRGSFHKWAGHESATSTAAQFNTS